MRFEERKVNVMQVSMSDWIALTVGVIGLISAWLARSNRLPANVRRWINDLDQEVILQEIGTCAVTMAQATAEERRDYMVNWITDLAKIKLGLTVPKSIANLIVEYCYQLWKRAVGNKRG